VRQDRRLLTNNLTSRIYLAETQSAAAHPTNANTPFTQPATSILQNSTKREVPSFLTFSPQPPRPRLDANSAPGLMQSDCPRSAPAPFVSLRLVNKAWRVGGGWLGRLQEEVQAGEDFEQGGRGAPKRPRDGEESHIVVLNLHDKVKLAFSFLLEVCPRTPAILDLHQS
jgi:hypothetical protein